MLLRNDFKVLFQGDSITDSCRTDNVQDLRYFGEENLGTGYPHMVAAVLAARYPALNVHYYNRAISGNRTIDLVNRWQQDCLDIAPDVLVLLVGINDIWRKFDANDPTSTEQFLKNYRYLLESAKAANPDMTIVIIEPCYYNTPCEHTTAFRTELLDKIEALRMLANTLGCYYIPLDGMLAAKCMTTPYTKWLFEDGVHLTGMGHGLVADALIRLFEQNA